MPAGVVTGSVVSVPATETDCVTRVREAGLRPRGFVVRTGPASTAMTPTDSALGVAILSRPFPKPDGANGKLPTSALTSSAVEPTASGFTRLPAAVQTTGR